MISRFNSHVKTDFTLLNLLSKGNALGLDMMRDKPMGVVSLSISSLLGLNGVSHSHVFWPSISRGAGHKNRWKSKI